VNLDITRLRNLLQESDFKSIFIEELGWGRCNNKLDISLDGMSFDLSAVAEKHGMVVFLCAPLPDGSIPDYSLRRKIERQAAKSVHEHIIIYTNGDKTNQIWQWVKREPGKPTACREHTYHINQPGDSLIQKLQAIVFSLEEEETLTIIEVSGRARAAFDVERITKRFYDRFKTEHDTFLKFIDGIPDNELQRWYASVMLNRLMFIYFIQKKGFLDNDENYLINRLHQNKEKGKDRFYKNFLCPLFFEGFAKKEKDRSAEINRLLGTVPYLNGGLFLKHQIEELHGKHIDIADKAFEKLFDFFDQYQWHLDERPLKRDNEINPDVLGYIFEKYINQKQMGAYYTKEDITGYISKNTVIPFLFDAVKEKCKIAFVANGRSPDTTVWKLLQTDPDRYFYPAVKKGTELPLPEKVAVGFKDVSRRTEWNKPALPDYALPTEIWREVVARRQRYEEVKAKMLNGELQSINDLITYNLDIRQFAQDVIWNSEGPELLRAFYHAIEKVTVLDPTCGSGAFLFAALNILEPLYEACLDRMQVFVNELDIVGAGLVPAPDTGQPQGLPLQKQYRSDKYGDFKKILKRVEEHPNLKYFIFKSIIVNNLYGVDIMEEAIEICKLRLFLKLVAQIESVEHIEPLPDIDFNIRAGNTLVGFATYDEVKQAVTSKLDFENTMERIEEQAQDIDSLFKLFQKQQTELGGEVTPEDKQKLRTRLKALEDELNQYLAGGYGINPVKKTDYRKWLDSHKPFHWFIEFYGILKSGGFDVIIGNPPYVEYSKVKNEYTIGGYQTESCGNLYAFIMERSFNLQAQSGRCGMIIPISLACSERMTSIRNFTLQKCKNAWFCNFAIRPQPLFPEIMQRNSIFILQLGVNHDTKVYSTNYIRWAAIERENLFPRIRLAEVTHITHKDSVIPKVASKIEVNIIKTIRDNRVFVGMLKGKSGILYFHDSGESYWTKTLLDKPIAYRNNKRVEPSQWFNIEISITDRPFVYLLLNSNLLYWLWAAYTDCRHMTKGFIESLPIPSDRNISKNLVEKLQQAYSKNTILFEKRPGYKSLEIKVHNFKPIIDEIDQVLAKHYGFTDEELDFIINYDIKYRMGRESDEE